MFGDLYAYNLYIYHLLYLQHADFSQCDLLDDWIIFRLYKFFNGHYLTCVPVSAFEHNSIRALADLSQFLILIHLTEIMKCYILQTNKQTHKVIWCGTI